MKETRGRVYFAIKTEDKNLNIEDFNKHLHVIPTKFEKMFARVSVPKCTIWEYSSGDLINPLFYKEIENLIAKLSPYKEEFKQFKSECPEINFVLEVVIYLGDETPALGFDTNTIDFLNYLSVKIDCDIYNRLSNCS